MSGEARERLDVGFVPAEVPGGAGTGAVETSALLIEHLSHHHDLTVYVASQRSAEGVDLPGGDRVEYVMHDDLPKLPHPITAKHRALREELPAMERHDLVHSYSAAFIPPLAELDVPTISTLNSYVPVCPKGDMMYRGKRKCSGPSPVKCTACVAATAVDRRQGVEEELRGGYSSLGKIPLVRNSIARCEKVDAYHAISPHLVDDFAALGFPRERITVVPHFYDEEFYRPVEDADSVGIGSGAVELLYVGGLRDFKGVQHLVTGLGVLRDRGRDVTLRIAGSGPYESRLHDLAREAGVEDDIEWLGYVDHDDLPDLYADADAFVYPGLIDEPFGRVLLEALAAGTPVIASAVGSTDYIVGDAGERFEAGNSTAMADACERLVDDYATHVRAIPAQLERFAPEAVEIQFNDLYHRIANGRASTTSSANEAAGYSD